MQDDIPEEVVVICYVGHADGGSKVALVVPTAIVSQEEMFELTQWNLRCPWKCTDVHRNDARIVAAYLAHKPHHPYIGGEECLERWPEFKELYPEEFDPENPPSSAYAWRVPWQAMEYHMLEGKWSQFAATKERAPLLKEGQRAVQVFMIIKNTD